MRSRLLAVCVGIVAGIFVAVPVAEQESGLSADSSFTMALTGDSIITRKLSVYAEPNFIKMIELLRSADVAFTNIEMLFHDYESYPMSSSGGTYMRASPELTKDLVWAGIDLGSLANNHSGDYGPPAMLRSADYVRKAGIVAAGVGKSLAEAREAKFLETAEGRVALISVSSTFPDHSRAGRSRDDVPARPGLNPLRYSTQHVVTQERLESLRETMQDLGFETPESSDELTLFGGQRFVAGDVSDVLTEPDPQDMAEIASVVNNASRLADYTIVTIHAHERDKELSVPAKFLVTFARAMIEAGADVFVGHGPHVLRGIEIHQGKPILYSLGDFIFQNETLLRLPQENYERYGLGARSQVADFNDARYEGDTIGFPAKPEIWESVIAVPFWKDGNLERLELHPISLGYGQPRQVRGRPMLAGADLSRKIISDLQRVSGPFGTKIDYVDGIGIVDLK